MTTRMATLLWNKKQSSSSSKGALFASTDDTTASPRRQDQVALLLDTDLLLLDASSVAAAGERRGELAWNECVLKRAASCLQSPPHTRNSRSNNKKHPNTTNKKELPPTEAFCATFSPYNPFLLRHTTPTVTSSSLDHNNHFTFRPPSEVLADLREHRPQYPVGRVDDETQPNASSLSTSTAGVDVVDAAAVLQRTICHHISKLQASLPWDCGVAVTDHPHVPYRRVICVLLSESTTHTLFSMPTSSRANTTNNAVSPRIKQSGAGDGRLGILEKLRQQLAEEPGGGMELALILPPALAQPNICTSHFLVASEDLSSFVDKNHSQIVINQHLGQDLLLSSEDIQVNGRDGQSLDDDKNDTDKNSNDHNQEMKCGSLEQSRTSEEESRISDMQSLREAYHSTLLDKDKTHATSAMDSFANLFSNFVSQTLQDDKDDSVMDPMERLLTLLCTTQTSSSPSPSPLSSLYVSRQDIASLVKLRPSMLSSSLSTEEDPLQEGSCLQRLIQLQVMIRFQLVCLSHDENTFFSCYQRILSQHDTIEVSSKKGKKKNSKKKQNKQSRKRKSDNQRNSNSNINKSPRLAFLEDITLILALAPFVLPSSAASNTFVDFLNLVVAEPFYATVSSMVTHVYDFFELTMPLDNNKNNRKEDDEPMKHTSEATVPSDDETNDRPLPQTASSPVHPLTKKLQEQAALFANKEQAIPILLDNHRTNKKEKEKASTANAFLSKSMNLTARCSSSSNRLLSSGKRRYVGSHFNTKLSNISNLFREVKVPRPKSDKRAAAVPQPNKMRFPSQQHEQHPYPRSALSSASSQLRKQNHVDFMPKPTTFTPARTTHFSMGQQQQQPHTYSKPQGFLTQPSFGNGSSLLSHPIRMRENLVQETPRRASRKRSNYASTHDDDDAIVCPMTPNNNHNELSPVAPPHRHAAHVAAEAALAASKRRR